MGTVLDIGPTRPKDQRRLQSQPSPTQDTDQAGVNRILNTWAHLGYIKGRSALPSDEEGVVYSDHSGDERPQNQQNQQQAGLDLNATANASQKSAGRNTETGGTQNGQPNLNDNNTEGWGSTSAFDRLGPGQPEPMPFGGIGSDDTQIMQDLSHRMQAMEREVKEIQKENTELKNVAPDLKA
ncbi:hypothetical protein PIB30_001747 [Stylosanthes scabra]|uniref:Uncharacterized protein n=1 Tax=Stylosanthes scabra TaxID=79078 RepID=A0ABU6V2H7_9FABA|nr:hypothetical protein [Stylosanthes scabra]